MPLIVEDGTGVEDANSYATDAWTTAYLTARGLAAAWTAIGTQADRDAKQVQAADFLNSLKWQGSRLFTDQTMALPRDAFDGVPPGVRAAQALLALEAVGGPLLPSVAAPAVVKERKKLDGVGEKEYEYAEPQRGEPVYLFLAGLIGDYLQSTPGSQVQVVRRYAG